jgi:hypothetical protein
MSSLSGYGLFDEDQGDTGEAAPVARRAGHRAHTQLAARRWCKATGENLVGNCAAARSGP